MPFPWKKVKNTRISQLVNDHLSKSQKRRDGSSLVVETGFPTSLVDLFMKNREKLKKPAKKKRQSAPITPLFDVNDPVITRSSSLSESLSPVNYRFSAASPTNPMRSPLRCPSPLRSPPVAALPSTSRGVNEILVGGSRDAGVCVGLDERERGVNAIGVLLVVLKMFLVVVLALGTKRLTAGITISAFLLFFLDYLGKRLCRLSTPCSEAKGVFMSMVQRVCRSLRLKEVRVDQKSTDVLMPEAHKKDSRCSSPISSIPRCPNQEIQVVESKSYLVTRVEEIQWVNEVIGDDSRSKGRLHQQEIESKEVMTGKEESSCEIAELKKKSRRAKIKSKMMKLVPKKLRKKGHGYQRLDSFIEDNEASCDGSEDMCESESVSELSSLSSGMYRDEDRTSVSSVFGALSEINEEAFTKNEEEDVYGEKGAEGEDKCREVQAGQTWRYMVPCSIVLLGLIGGRGFALIVTLLWFLLLKVFETLPTHMKVSL